MASWLNALTIRTKLLLLVLPLLALLAVLVTQRVLSDWQEKIEYRTGMAVVSKVGVLAELVHQTQLERGLSVAWLNSGDASDLAALKTQRQRADQALTQGGQALEAAIGRVNGAAGLFTTELASFKTLASELGAQRRAIDERSTAPADAAVWYTTRITGLIAAIHASIAQSPDVVFADKIQAYAYLVSKREYTGRERNAINAALTTGKPMEPAALAQLHALLGRQATYAELYRRAASPEDVRVLNQSLDAPAVREAQRIRELVLARAAEGRYGVEPAAWWSAVTARMDLLKAHDTRIGQELSAAAAQKAAQAEQRFWTTLAVATALTLAVLLMAYLIVTGIQRRLQTLQQAMVRIGGGFNFGERVQVQGADEIAATAASFNDMVRTIAQALAEVDQVMAALAAGDFTREVQAPLSGDMARLKDSVNTTRERLGSTVAVLNDALTAMQNGDFSHPVTVQAEGQYRRALECADSAMTSLQTMVGSIGQVMAAVATGNLAERVHAQGQGQLARLRDDINRSLDALSQAMGQIHVNTRLVATASNETSNAIGQIADGAQNQTHALGQVAAAVRQTSTAVSDVSRNTSSASEQSRDSVDIVRRGMHKMQHMVEVVDNIAANSARISKITEMIEKIANKTNMLSLNAAIEAARAGEHGKGFAVVADEIGKLAVSSAQSSQEIARLVQQAVSEIAEAVRAVQEVQGDMSRIESGAHQTDNLLRQISSALEEQSSAVEEINANLSSLDRIARSNAAAAEEITATVIELSKLADGTRAEVERFRLAAA